MSRLIDADELNEYIGREALDTREKIFALVHRMPTVERPHGEWIDTGYGTRRCSVCGEKCQTYCMDKPRDRYCLWCGADMRKEGDEK